MGTMIFQLPADLSRDAASELERAWVSGLDHMPWPTQAQVDHHRLLVQRRVGESGCLVAPWNMEGAVSIISCWRAASSNPLHKPPSVAASARCCLRVQPPC